MCGVLRDTTDFVGSQHAYLVLIRATPFTTLMLSRLSFSFFFRQQSHRQSALGQTLSTENGLVEHRYHRFHAKYVPLREERPWRFRTSTPLPTFLAFATARQLFLFSP